MEKLKETLKAVLDFSTKLSERQFTFFLGAGFSKNVDMPDFWTLVRERILPKFFADLEENK